ncbi:hypothetical protein DFR87_02870 [Metallosphaera hakonensis JCM 8857 = DSM 7519]|uniref:Uncharacterized protein n=2 Tax=Metallosphaera hakonensis TaxID=79601 RepID=A0A2U9IS24_9CREN|nr:hypothetical protein DFR87_02870 [Metallosphaera hakonensis JCM 8857 = DSM 7519]
MDYWLQRYQSEKPSMKVEIIDMDIPCNTTCLESTEFKSLLENEAFRSRMEVIDSLFELIKDQVRTLRREISQRVQNQNVNIDELTFTIFRLVEYGGNTSLGEKLTFNDKVIATGSFRELVDINKSIEKMRSDQDIRSICDEIRYLIEALWEHFNKNMVKVQ